MLRVLPVEVEGAGEEGVEAKVDGEDGEGGEAREGGTERAEGRCGIVHGW